MALTQPVWLAGQLLASNTTFYMSASVSLIGDGTLSGDFPETLEFRVLAPIDGACTLKNLRVRLLAAPGGTGTRTFTVRKNGADQSVAVTFTSADTNASDLSDTVTFASGDTISIKQTATNTPAATGFQLTYELEHAGNFSSVYGFGKANTLDTSTTPKYSSLFAAGARWTSQATEALALSSTAGVIPSYRVLLSTAPGGVTTRTFALEKNGVLQDGSGGTPNTTLVLTGATTSGTATFTLNIAAGDVVQMKEVAAGTPADSYCYGSHTFVATTHGQMVFCANPQDAPTAAGATEYCHAIGGGISTFGATESVQEHLGPTSPIALTAMRVDLVAAPSSGTSQTYALRKNNADTTQTLTVADLATEETSVGAAVTLTSADRFAIKAVTSGATSSTAVPRFAFLLTDPTILSSRNLLTGQFHEVTGSNTVIAGKSGTVVGEQVFMANMKSGTPDTYTGDNAIILNADYVAINGVDMTTPSGAASPTTTKGDLIVRSSSVDDRLPVGANGEVLTADSAETLGMKWAASVAGAFVKIEEQTPSGVSSVTFSSLGSYTHLRISYAGRGSNAAVSNAITLRFNGDTGANYDRQSTISSATTAAGQESLGATSVDQVGILAAASAPSGSAGGGEINVFDYRGTTFHKTGTGLFMVRQNTGSANTLHRSVGFVWRSTAAVTSITITLAAGNFEAGSKFSLYGIT